MSFMKDGKARAEARRRNFKTTDPETGEVTVVQALNAPPRNIGFFGRIYTLISGWQMNMGLVFAGVGLMLFIIGFRALLRENARAASGGTFLTTVGTITKIAINKGEKKIEVEREFGKERRIKVDDPQKNTYAYTYAYTVGEKEYISTAHFGNADHFAINKAENDTLMVEYFSTDPTYANIVGYRGGDVSSILLGIGIIFAVAGIGFLIFGGRSRAKTLRLYLLGQVAWGKLVSSTKTNMKVNNSYVYSYVYAFAAQDGQQCEAIVKAPSDFNMGDQQELVLYLSENPKYNIVYDAIDTAPIINPDGSLRVKQKIGAWFCLVLFIVCVTLAVFAPATNF